LERQAIYVTHPGARVHRADGLVAVSVERAVVGRWPVEELDRVLLFGNAQITTQVLALLFKHGVHVAFFSSSGRYRGQLVSPESGNVFLRLAQHARYADPVFRLALARDLVATKIRAARALVRRYARNHADADEVMSETAGQLSRALVQVDTVPDGDALLGVEGAAAAQYFRSFDRMVRAPFRFERRSKHPAHNAVNALLNLGYTMLAGEVASRLEALGFDPRIGYYHGVRYGRSSLALDLVEAHRVDVVDRLTLAIMNRRMLAPEDFEEKGSELGTRLAPAALRRYLALYEGAMREGEPSPRARIEEQANALRRAVMSGAPPAPRPGALAETLDLD
jgi:CRISPR-associated protein Cas1